ncbi:MAG: nitroreductase family protein [Candidatus Bathyarchaeia archaeon]|jgi:hypothetical protein
MRALGWVVFCLVCLLIGVGTVGASSFEVTVSQRYSDRSFTSDAVSGQQLLSVLQDGYGSFGSGRVVPQVGSDYSLVIFAVNASGCYRYDPGANSVSMFSAVANLAKISPDFDQSWPSTANVVLVLVWDQTKVSSPYVASLEAGCVAQNVYLAVIGQGLGTTFVGSIDSSGLQSDLGLESSMVPIAVMPMGFPISPYPSATPDYVRMTGNLPQVQTSPESFVDALSGMSFVQSWTGAGLSQQELSQLLWAAYGYSSTGHRTTPSANDIYPLVVYISNSTGTYRYVSESHMLSLVQAGDQRNTIASACNNQAWVASAPSVLLVTVDSSYNGGSTGDGGVLDHEWVEVDAGCVVQQILLESSVVNLSGNAVTNGLVPWNGNGAQTLRNALGFASSIITLCVVPVGHVAGSPSPSPSPSAGPSPSGSVIPSGSPFMSPSPTISPSSSQTGVPSPIIPELLPAYMLVILVAVTVFSVFILKRNRREHLNR